MQSVHQWWNVTKYIHLITVPQCTFFSWIIPSLHLLLYLLLQYILEADIVISLHYIYIIQIKQIMIIGEMLNNENANQSTLQYKHTYMYRLLLLILWYQILKYYLYGFVWLSRIEMLFNHL